MLGVAMLIPVNPTASACALALAFVFWLSAGNWSERLPDLAFLRQMMPLFLLYVLALLGMSWSTEPEFGWNILRVQLPLMLLPVMLLSVPKGYSISEALPKIAKAFIAGNILVFGLCLVHATARYIETQNPDVFSYGELVYWLYLHPAYSTFYSGLAALLLVGMVRKEEMIRGWQRFFFAILIAFIFLLNSRVTIIYFMVVFSLLAFWRWWLNGQRLRFVAVMTFVVAVGVVISFGLPQNRNRLASMFQTEEISVEEGSASLRVEIWKGALQTLKEQPLSGFGTGSVRHNLVASYQKRGFQEGVDAAFNAHNQYLQTWLMLGIPGLLLLILILGKLIQTSWLSNHPERAAAVLFFALAMFSEAMLERQMGVLPFAFFASLWYAQPGNLKSATKPLSKMLVEPLTIPDLQRKGGG